jgi:RNA 3'-terminal phosphate cyclase
MLEFFGSELFRQRLVLACISGKSIRIVDIRSNEENPGLKGIFVFIYIVTNIYLQIMKYYFFV